MGILPEKPTLESVGMLLFPLLSADTVASDTADTLIRRDTFIKSPTAAAIRSAVLPGWGQWYNGAPVKGVILGLITLGATANTAYRYLQMRRAGSYSYDLTTAFLGALILNVAAWGYTVADAFVDAYLYGLKEYKDTLKADLSTPGKPPSAQEPPEEKNEENDKANGDEVDVEGSGKAHVGGEDVVPSPKDEDR